MKKLLAIVAVAVAVLSGLSFAASEAQHVTKKDFAGVCPLDLPGVSATAAKTAAGVDVVFGTTVASAIPDLQGRLGLLSDLLNRAVAHPASGAERAAVSFASKAEATPEGGRLILTPKNPADLEKLQANVSGKIGAMNAAKSCHLLANVN